LVVRLVLAGLGSAAAKPTAAPLPDENWDTIWLSSAASAHKLVLTRV
jgi:hypothetical protein